MENIKLYEDNHMLRLEQAQADFLNKNNQFAQLLVALKSQIDEMQKVLQSRVTVTAAQARIVQNALRNKAIDTCEFKGLDYALCGTAIRSAIRRELYSIHGVGSFYDMPARELQTALDYIATWSSLALIRKLRDKYGG